MFVPLFIPCTYSLNYFLPGVEILRVDIDEFARVAIKLARDVTLEYAEVSALQQSGCCTKARNVDRTQASETIKIGSCEACHPAILRWTLFRLTMACPYCSLRMQRCRRPYCYRNNRCTSVERKSRVSSLSPRDLSDKYRRREGKGGVRRGVMITVLSITLTSSTQTNLVIW